jgi:hypothetical protein
MMVYDVLLPCQSDVFFSIVCYWISIFVLGFKSTVQLLTIEENAREIQETYRASWLDDWN